MLNWDVHTALKQGSTNFPKIRQTPQNSKRHSGDIKFYPQDPQISGDTVKKIVARVTWLSRFAQT
jgi:hypothetical protein